MPDTSPERILFTVRSGDGTFRVVSSKAQQALAHVEEMVERGLDDVNVTDAYGRRYDLRELQTLADIEAIGGRT